MHLSTKGWKCCHHVKTSKKNMDPVYKTLKSCFYLFLQDMSEYFFNNIKYFCIFKKMWLFSPISTIFFKKNCSFSFCNLFSLLYFVFSYCVSSVKTQTLWNINSLESSLLSQRTVTVVWFYPLSLQLNDGLILNVCRDGGSHYGCLVDQTLSAMHSRMSLEHFLGKWKYSNWHNSA